MAIAKWTFGIVALAAAGMAPLAPAFARPATDTQQASPTAREEANKRAVVEFYNQAINEKDYAAASRYLGDTYIQHNPTAPDGAEGLKGFIAFLKSKFPQQHNEIKRVFADGNYVILHVHSVQQPGTPGRAIVDIFRLDDDGKVVEHWDVIQDVTPPGQAKNDNGMF